jgi:transcriptional regulator
MYCPTVFAVDDLDVLHSIIRQRVFATLALAHEGRVYLAYAPVALTDEGKGMLHFHLAVSNRFAELADNALLSVSFMGPDAYVSPDWYETDGRAPTWNYIAVEGTGTARRLSPADTLTLLNELSAQEEEKLLPKAPWTLDKMQRELVGSLLNGIAGFSLPLNTLEGKFKLSQDKSPGDIARVIAALETRGDVASLAVAAAMRHLS